MRLNLRLLAIVALPLLLAGCASQSDPEPHSPIDPDEAQARDYVAPAVVFAAAALLGLSMLAVGWLLRRRQREARRDEAPGDKKERGP